MGHLTEDFQMCSSMNNVSIQVSAQNGKGCSATTRRRRQFRTLDAALSGEVPLRPEWAKKTLSSAQIRRAGIVAATGSVRT